MKRHEGSAVDARPLGKTFQQHISQAAFKVKHHPSQPPVFPGRSVTPSYGSQLRRCAVQLSLSLPDECGDLGHPGFTLNEYRRGLLCEL